MLETYGMRTQAWIPRKSVLSRGESDPREAVETAIAEEANELIQRRIDDARLTAQINRQNADTRRFWGAIVPRGGKC